ncbi:MAG TPA: hypothetical protein DCL38_09390 [Lachnospiraceae bacterium]|nr:hypothetical protein [Lachnospiraceae bacterium]
MSNKEIYKATLTFSLHRVLYDIGAFVLLLAFGAIGFWGAQSLADAGLAGLLLGLIIGFIFFAVILRYVSYTYKAGQIAMMTRAVTEGALPDNVLSEGKKAVKERFVTVALFYAATRAIRAVFNELGRMLSRVGRAVGGKNGESVADVISAVVSVVVAYLCDCCLGWIFFRRNENAARAACEGAVIFFKNWKVLAKNMGRVFGFGLSSLLVIGGIFTGIFYGIASFFPDFFTALAEELAESGDLESGGEFLTDPAMLMLFCAVLCAVVIWSILHSVFIRPLVLTGVLRNYLKAGIEDMPTEESFALLDEKSKQFRKLHSTVS